MLEDIEFTSSMSVFVVWWGGSQARLHADYKSAIPAPAQPSASRRAPTPCLVLGGWTTAYLKAQEKNKNSLAGTH